MEGHNPDASLLPSVGGTITPMSGGGLEGGFQETSGRQQILETELAEYESHPEMVQALQTLAPTEVGSLSIKEYFEKKGTGPKDDEALKREIMATIQKPEFIKDIKFVIESKKNDGITEANIQAVLAHLSKQSLDISTALFSLDPTGLSIEIPIAKATASAVATKADSKAEAEAKSVTIDPAA